MFLARALSAMGKAEAGMAEAGTHLAAVPADEGDGGGPSQGNVPRELTQLHSYAVKLHKWHDLEARPRSAAAKEQLAALDRQLTKMEHKLRETNRVAFADGRWLRDAVELENALAEVKAHHVLRLQLEVEAAAGEHSMLSLSKVKHQVQYRQRKEYKTISRRRDKLRQQVTKAVRQLRCWRGQPGTIVQADLGDERDDTRLVQKLLEGKFPWRDSHSATRQQLTFQRDRAEQLGCRAREELHFLYEELVDMVYYYRSLLVKVYLLHREGYIEGAIIVPPGERLVGSEGLVGPFLLEPAVGASPDAVFQYCTQVASCRRALGRCLLLQRHSVRLERLLTASEELMRSMEANADVSALFVGGFPAVPEVPRWVGIGSIGDPQSGGEVQEPNAVEDSDSDVSLEEGDAAVTDEEDDADPQQEGEEDSQGGEGAEAASAAV